MLLPASNACWNTAYWNVAPKIFYRENFGSFSDGKLPIIYHDRFNIEFWGLEKLHPFDASKFRRILEGLVSLNVLKKDQTVTPYPATREHLKLIHDEDYLDSLENPVMLAQIAEFPLLALMPAWLAKQKFTDSYLYHVGDIQKFTGRGYFIPVEQGTILAGMLALDCGWAVSLGGGMHHAWSKGGGGWCVFSDIVLSYQHLRLAFPNRINRVLIIDLDVHQGNGHERDKIIMGDNASTVFTIDAYRHALYPGDAEAKRAIDIPVELWGDETDDIYVSKIQEALAEAFSHENKFDIAYFIAGTDILESDPLGGMNISLDGVVRRDELVWQICFNAQVPIVQVLAGGYTKPLSANTVMASLANLKTKGFMQVK